MADLSARPARAHHFEDAGQQYQASLLGMWAFLVTELLFFGGLFLAYGLYRWLYPAAFAAASHHLNVELGALNTAILITSSLTMALAVHAGHCGHKRALPAFLMLTAALGAAFMGIKAVEYAHKFHEHLVPGAHFHLPEYTGPGGQIFFSLYFGMTGLHALHMVIGLGILGVLTVQSLKGKFDRDYSTPVEMTGLYWHFVDIIWIFLFPLLYLIGRHG